ncbi:MAG: hypothetical protein LLG14_16765 [Nocardiaceae bacterium]|nr:hypothetical protein [Nocardiaceae bacterium]
MTDWPGFDMRTRSNRFATVDRVMMTPREVDRKVRQLDNDVQAIYVMLADLSATQKRQGTRLDEIAAVQAEQAELLGTHTATLDSHTATLDSHTATLDSHTAKLDSHTATLDSHTAKLDSHTVVLTEHGHKLDQIIGLLQSRP